jgi:hypothetical protein
MGKKGQHGFGHPQRQLLLELSPTISSRPNATLWKKGHMTYSIAELVRNNLGKNPQTFLN